MKSFLAIAFTILTSISFAQEFSSYTQCNAYTACFDGWGREIGVATCNVVGSSYINYGDTSNSCSWYVQPAVGVQCSGFAQVINQWGQYEWAWQNYEARCPGF